MSVRDEANPDALQGAPRPRAGHHDVNGTRLYFESRGSGPGVMIIGASDEDAEFFRPIAERITGRTVITYDRRGSLRSGREDWPGGGSVQHADDAAGMITSLGLTKTTVLGASAGGIVALRLALRYPELVHRALIFEPGLFCHLPDGEETLSRLYRQVDLHLESNPNDWVGGVERLGRAVADEMGGASPNFFSPPVNREWYSRRAELGAESLIREDLSLTLERIPEEELANCPTRIRFAFGAGSLTVFRLIATELARTRGGRPDRIEEVGHAVYYSPDVIASYVMAHAD